MTRALVAAPFGRLVAEVSSKVTKYDGAVPPTPNRPTVPYLVYYPSTVPRGRDRLAPLSGVAVVRFQVTSVGQGVRESAQAVDDAARAAVLDWRPAVQGWQCNPVTEDEAFSAPITRDPDSTALVFFAVARYYFTAVPAPTP